MGVKIDLHIHTNFSDGAHSPEEIVRLAYLKNFKTIAITDHDTIDAIPRAREYARKFDVEILAGVELSTQIGENEIHILGYFPNAESATLKEHLAVFKHERVQRAIRIVQKLNKLGLDLSVEEVMNEAGNSVVGRPHIAKAMVKKGLAKNFYEAFEKYLKDEAPAYESKSYLSPTEAIRIIKNSGGLSFIAHPANMKEKILYELIDAGIDGIEIIHPSHNNALKKFYENVANRFSLLKSGGSDFHGGIGTDENNFGKFLLPPQYYEEIKTRLEGTENFSPPSKFKK
jgi:predicted metal-dependent phosphoesterase TrpH